MPLKTLLKLWLRLELFFVHRPHFVLMYNVHHRRHTLPLTFAFDSSIVLKKFVGLRFYYFCCYNNVTGHWTLKWNTSHKPQIRDSLFESTSNWMVVSHEMLLPDSEYCRNTHFHSNLLCFSSFLYKMFNFYSNAKRALHSIQNIFRRNSNTVGI